MIGRRKKNGGRSERPIQGEMVRAQEVDTEYRMIQIQSRRQTRKRMK